MSSRLAAMGHCEARGGGGESQRKGRLDSIVRPAAADLRGSRWAPTGLLRSWYSSKRFFSGGSDLFELAWSRDSNADGRVLS